MTLEENRIPPPVDVSVLIVSYNTCHQLRACLASIEQGTERVSYEVVVADNASADDSTAMVRAEFPQVQVLELDTNVGFGRGINTAARAARGRYLVLVNPDAVLHPGALDRLHAFATSRPSPGIYGGRALTADGTVDQRSCWGFPSPWSLACFGLGLSTAMRGSARFDPESLGRWPRDSTRSVDAVSGSFLMISQQLWSQLGGFDPTYFMYAEDLDLCQRAAHLGHRPMVTPDAVISHAGGASSASHGAKMTMVMRGKVTFLQRHWSPSRCAFGVAMLRLGVAARAAGQVLAGRAKGGGGTREPAWVEVWRARQVWSAGYPPAPGEP